MVYFILPLTLASPIQVHKEDSAVSETLLNEKLTQTTLLSEKFKAVELGTTISEVQRFSEAILDNVLVIGSSQAASINSQDEVMILFERSVSLEKSAIFSEDTKNLVRTFLKY